ncbi:MAG TPA: PrsW family glutamic-type intramembrane protease, partial [Bradyrhizobium sp.]
VLQGVIGHMAWAGIFGYFIGLVARYPGSMIKLLTIGWLVAAVLHTLWDAAAVSNSVTGLWVDGAITLFVFVGCFLKAKQLEAVRKGPAFIPTDSIIVGGVPLPVATGTLPEHNATAWGGLSQVVGAFFRPKATTATPGAFPMGAPAVPQPSMAAPQAAPVPRFILSNGAERYGIVAGQTIDLAMLFPGRGLSSGTLAEVTVHPQDAKAIGLKNMTSVVWAVTLDTGATTTVAAGRSVKLVANEKIKIGAVTIDVQAV